MKAIDLLNKIANGEEVPKKIKYLCYEYEFNEKEKQYQRCFNGVYYGLGEDIILDIILDKQIEILEEPKGIPEKIEIYKDEEGHYFIDKHCKKIYITCDEVNFMVEEFNQLLDYLESKGDE